MNSGARRVDPWIERLARLMDNSIALGRWRIGLDGLLGLIPGVGDVAGGAVSAVIILRAAAAGLPRAAIARMAANVAIDSLLGSVPVAGDLFDFAYKANAKNLKIYRESFAGGGTARHWGFLAAVAALLAAALALPVAELVALYRAIG